MLIPTPPTRGETMVQSGARLRLGVLLCTVSFATACGLDLGQSDDVPLQEDDFGGPGPTEDAGTQQSGDVGSDALTGEVPYSDRIAAVETRLVSSTWRAGQAFTVDCLLVDANGVPVTSGAEPEFSVDAAPDTSFEVSGREVTGMRAGDGRIRCGVPDLGLVDDSPESVTITPASPDTVVTFVDQTRIGAGETVTATCEVFDAYGNVVDDVEPSLTTSPSGSGVDVTGLAATIEVADLYDVSCEVAGASNVSGVTLEVVPALPDSLAMTKLPNQAVYAVGQVVTFATVVNDVYGNEIDNADVAFDVSPNAQPFGLGRFRFNDEGTFDVTASVRGATEGGKTLEETTQVVVNGSGPAIDCIDPPNATMQTLTPGTTTTFRGEVSDANGVSSATVDGSTVSVASDGSFSVPVDVRYGVNFVEIVTEDDLGAENSRTCAFLAASDWEYHAGYIDDSVMLKLRQPAIEDGNASDLDSLDDLLETVLNSSGLENEIDTALSNANPLKPMSCDQEACAFGTCVCVVSSKVTYKDMQLNGPNSTSLDLVSGGLRAVATIRDLRVKVRVNGKVSGIGYDTTGWVTFDYVKVDLTMDLELQNGVPGVSLRRVNSVDVGDISTDFSGLDGAVIDAVVSLFQGSVKNLVKNTIRDYVTDNFDAVLDGFVSSLDISSIASSFPVPRLDGTGDVDLDFNVRFSSLGVTSSRALFGVGTRVTGPTTNARPTKGVAIPPGGIFTDPSSSSPVTVAVHTGVLNQALHALWRAGFFDTTIDGSLLGSSFPAGAQAQLSTSLPPVVANLNNGDVEVTLGGVRLTVTYPGVFDTPVALDLGARATTDVQISGDALTFGNISVDELVFSANFTTLDSNSRSTLEGFLQSLVQELVDQSLNGALPALPIPAFTIPSSLGTFGLPVGDELSITSSTFDTTTSHYRLKGGFGVR